MSDSNKVSEAAERLSEELLYASVLKEIEDGVRRDGIWAKAMVTCDGDQVRAKSEYIKLRVQALQDEMVLAEEADRIEAEEAAARELDEKSDWTMNSDFEKMGFDAFSKLRR